MKNAFFDLDGTLTDPKEGIVRCIQHALAELGERVPDDDELLWCIGPPLQESFPKLLGGHDRADLAVHLYRQRFSEVGMFENSVYGGIPAVLETLKEAGVHLHVATSKPHVYAMKILEHFDLLRHFEMVFGAELDGTRADKSDLLAYALAQSHADARCTTMVGDRKHDVIGALNNGLQAVGVLYGYGSQNELEQAKAHALAACPEDILPLVID